MTTSKISELPRIHGISAVTVIALPLCAGALAIVPALEAAVQPVAQTRSVSTFATVSIPGDVAHDSDSSAAPDFALFDDAVESSQALPGLSASANASQRSVLGQESFSFNGDFQAQALNSVEGGFAEGFGQSLFNYDFTVDVPTVFHLAGELIASGEGACHVSFLAGAVIFQFSNFGQGTLPVNETHELEPGVLYRIATNTNGFGQAFGTTETTAGGTIHLEGSLNAIVSVPAAADVAVSRVYPNPTRGPVVFEIAGDGAANDIVSLFDSSGRLVRSLPVVESRARWDGLTATGQKAAPGVYFYRTGGTQRVTARRLVVTR